jgi:hypothetical protein
VSVGDVNQFSTGDLSTFAIELCVDGDGAEVTLDQPTLSDEHRVQVTDQS